MRSDRAKITIDGLDITIVFRDYSRMSRATRVYVSGHANPDMEMPAYSIRGENAELDRLWRKYNKLEIESMRRVLDRGLRALAITDDAKFSRKAGCSCGCSAGFVLTQYTARVLGRSVTDIFITQPA